MAIGLRETWRALSPEQRVAGIAAVLLIISTFGPFSFVEGAQVLVAIGVLVLLHQRSRERFFHLPFGDGTVIAGAGLWSGLLIAVRFFERPLGQALLALACAAMLFAAGLRERAKRPADDMPRTRARQARGEPAWLDEDPPIASPPRGDPEARTRIIQDEQRTLPLPELRDDLPDVDEPPELDLGGRPPAPPDA